MYWDQLSKSKTSNFYCKIYFNSSTRKIEKRITHLVRQYQILNGVL